MSVMLCWVTEGEVLLGEDVTVREVPGSDIKREVPQGETEGEVPQGEAEAEVPLGEQEPLAVEIDHGLSSIFDW